MITIKNLRKIGFIIILGILCFDIVIPYSVGFKNLPTDDSPETPDKPKYYNFNKKKVGIFKSRHYGTHDWIADAALRLLIREPGAAKDWNWLLKDTKNNNPKWVDYYGDGTMHYTIRSYFSYLFATQMPDMKYDPMGKRPNKNPSMINLWGNEGEIIGDGRRGTNIWVGQIKQHSFHWNINKTPEGYYVALNPKASAYRAPVNAWRMAQAALGCLTHQEKDENGDFEIWSKPEAAACWLGVMTHYIADLASPPHLIQLKDEYYPNNPDFHGWYEKQVSKFTVWDEISGGPKGLKGTDNFFRISPSIIGKENQKIEEISPDLAATLTATESIHKCFKFIHQDGLFIEEGDNVEEELMKDWEWGSKGEERHNKEYILQFYGLTYKEYYDKVEYLLNLAIYYTAAAMKWVNKRFKEIQKEEINPDKWAKVPFHEKHPREEVPIYDHDKLRDIKKKEDIQKYLRELEIFITLGAMAQLMAIAVVPTILVDVVEKMVA